MSAYCDVVQCYNRSCEARNNTHGIGRASETAERARTATVDSVEKAGILNVCVKVIEGNECSGLVWQCL